MQDSVLLRTFPDPFQAEMARLFLESEGIATDVEDSGKFHAPPSVYGQNIFPVELRVAEADLEAAELLLKQSEAGLFAIDDANPDAESDDGGHIG